MCIDNFMKNIFLFLFLFVFLFVNKEIYAAFDYGTQHAEVLKKAGYTDADIKKIDENINNVSSGSTYIYTVTNSNPAGLGYVPSTDITLTKNLYNPDPEKDTLAPNELEGLKTKLQEGQSVLNQSDIKQEKVYQINRGNVTSYIYIYDPTPENKTNNDEVVLAAATKEGSFLVFKDPIKKEVSGRTQDENRSTKDIFSLDGVLNTIDAVNGRQVGTTVDLKNKKNDLQQVRDDLRTEYEQAQELTRAEREKLNNYTGNDASIRTALEGALKKAQEYEDSVGEKVVNAGGELAREEERLRQESVAANTSQSRGELGAGKCDNLVQVASNSFFCMTVQVAKFSNIIFKLTSFIAYIAGTLFDFSLEFSINSAEFIERLGVVEITWSFIRDILNMTFIFILLWTAIQILIGHENKYNAQKMLRNVIIIAILINFSLFATKLLVDGSNIVSLKIYEAMKANTGDKGSSISVRVMNTVGLTTLYDIKQIFNENNFQAEGNCATNPGALITVSVMGSIFLIILILALGLAAILFLIRLVNIIFLMIKSPLFVWSFIIPGNEKIREIGKKWQSEMMHVLSFPIMYLFWMLVAVIVFEKLGQIRPAVEGGQKTSLLKLICETPGASGFSESISLVAVFIIVIIMMMKAIEYGIRHAGDGGSESFGSGMATTVAKKFGGYQTAMTQGLAKRAGAVAVGAGALSVGAVKGSLKFAKDTTGRVGVGLVNGLGSKKEGTTFGERFGDGFYNPGIKTKEAFRDSMQSLASATANSGLAKFVGITGTAAKLAKKYDDPMNDRGETRKKANERRVATTLARQNNVTAAIDKKFKTDSYEDWKKKNPNESMEKYEEYVTKQNQQRIEKLLGEGISDLHREGSSETHLQELMKNSIKKDTDPTTGRITKIRFDESLARQSFVGIMKDKNTAEAIKDKKTDKFALHKKIKAEAIIKSISEANKKALDETTKKVANESREAKYRERTEELTKLLSNLPTEGDIKKLVDTQVSGEMETYKGLGDMENTVKAINKAVNDYNDYILSSTGSVADLQVVEDAREEVRKAIKAHKEFRYETEGKRDKENLELNKHLDKIQRDKDNEAAKKQAQTEAAKKAEDAKKNKPDKK